MLDISEELDTISPLEALRAYLENADLSERGFSKICGITASTFNEIIRMKRRPSVVDAMKIQNQTGIPAEALVLFWERNKVRNEIRQLVSG
ncbi:MAG TPA: hypothetical protein DD827_07055 [Gammaproteobacteria bacterium]|nr:hypothetical protein [Gammaproteobacteria bacterium]